MKKILTLVVALLTVFNLFAVDIIVTKDARRIEAKILEVSSTEIKYKEADNLEGPTFVLTSAELNTIIYSNGTVKVYDSQPAQQPAQQTSNAAQPSSAMTGLPIDKRDDYYYMGDMRMDEDQYLSFVRQNCPAAWEDHERGQGLWSTGWKLFATGAALTTCGAIMVGVGIAYGGYYRYGTYYASDNSVYWGCYVPGVIFTVSGAAIWTASIPCIIVGAVKRNNSYETYNEHCAARQQAQATPLTLSLTAGGNGLGVALNF